MIPAYNSTEYIFSLQRHEGLKRKNWPQEDQSTVGEILNPEVLCPLSKGLHGIAPPALLTATYISLSWPGSTLCMQFSLTDISQLRYLQTLGSPLKPRVAQWYPRMPFWQWPSHCPSARLSGSLKPYRKNQNPTLVSFTCPKPAPREWHCEVQAPAWYGMDSCPWATSAAAFICQNNCF